MNSPEHSVVGACASPGRDAVLVASWCAVGAVSTASVVFGAVSWAALPAWRHFRHFVLLNLLLNSSAPLIALRLLPYLWPSSGNFILNFSSLAYVQWLMVATIMFYIDFVTVFMNFDSINHLYLKASAFGWVLPLVWGGLAHVLDTFYIMLTGVCVIPLINFAVYVRVLCALYRGSRRGEADICKKVTLSTAAFVFTGVGTALLTLVAVIMIISESHTPASDFESLLRCCIKRTSVIWSIISALSTNVFFLSLRAHRELWAARAPAQRWRAHRELWAARAPAQRWRPLGVLTWISCIRLC